MIARDNKGAYVGRDGRLFKATFSTGELRPIAFEARVKAGLEKVVEATGPGNVGLVFAHGGVIGEACRQAADSRRFAFVMNDNCSLTRLVRFANGRWLLRSFNDTAHLAGSSPAQGGSAMVHAAASGSDDRQEMD